MSLSGFAHRFVPAEEPGAPTLLVLHGTGGDENDLLALGRMLRPGAAILSPRGRVLEQGMPRFFRRLAEGVFDQEDLARRTMELDEFIAASAATYHFDPSRVLAVGYSNGANIAASLLLARPRTLAGAVLFRAMLPFEPASTPDLSGRAILLSAGKQDPLIPQALTARLADLLREAGAEVTLSWHDTGHGLLQSEIGAAGRWTAEQF
ncbi:MAG: hypothetical protein A3H96_09230 [Acidobacteria bacterium RIFCSPLOWO2_02_FULL_67_36]|nr:MAG: hypothetical protein A3H96_09230 [Acidobacteria bacterium RIFCSPLOWO2_02_FULL_67_36]OFW25043.1 MAG: hypothetical protein A3G21_16505 [Acidobacteria bacterium RIFCSPLOWO2_12_FULL_66_21]